MSRRGTEYGHGLESDSKASSTKLNSRSMDDTELAPQDPMASAHHLNQPTGRAPPFLDFPHRQFLAFNIFTM